MVALRKNRESRSYRWVNSSKHCRAFGDAYLRVTVTVTTPEVTNPDIGSFTDAVIWV